MWTRFFNKQPGRLQQTIAAKLQGSFNRIQSTWAAYMARKTQAISPRTMNRYLLLFCLSLAFFNTCILKDAMQSHQQSRVAPTPISSPMVPKHPSQPSVKLSETERQAIRSLRHRMDSLAATPAGKATLDSFLAAHSGFQDSLAIAEQLIK